MINPFLSIKVSDENKKLADRLHNQMSVNFLGHAMYDINDALASILAICDMEGIENIPKIKHYIQRVNSLLSDVQIYQNSLFFNINHVLKNVADVVSAHFKNEAKLKCSFSEVKSLAKGNKLQLERLLIRFLIELITAERETDLTGVSVCLQQKERDAQVIIQKNNYKFSQDALDEINLLSRDFSGKISINPIGQGIEIDIRMPLDFTKLKKSDLSGVTVSDIREVVKKPIYRPESVNK
jgi:hypothetical protein